MLKIAITGPESTGKTTLAKELSEYYHTAFVPEYARIYLDSLNRNYSEEDLIIIAQGQIALEIETCKNVNNLLIADTEMTVIKIWNEFVFHRCHPQITEFYRQQYYDLYLLMDIDLPWHPDPLREHPYHREELYRLYCRELVQKKVNFITISGSAKSRLENAIQAIENLKIPKNSI